MLKYTTHLLLDAARMGDEINEAIKRNKAHDSLYRGGKEEPLAAVGPYIFSYQDDSPFGQWYLQNGWSNSWGILFKSSSPLPELYKHFRNFILVQAADRQKHFFRFYDPRVLRIFLPSCDASQLREFFGFIEYFIVEDEDPAFAIQFWHENGILKSKRHQTKDIFRKFPAAQHEDVSESLPLTESIETNAGSTAVIETNPGRQEATVQPEKQEPSSTPKPKTKWNMFD